jgi:hypothetical protein
VPAWIAITALVAGASLPAAVKATLLIVTSLSLVAIFVLAAVRHNAKMARHAAPATPESASFVMLSAHGRVSEAEIALLSPQYYFPVVQGRDVVGVLSKAALASALAGGNGDRLIVELMVQTGDVASRSALTRAEAR